MDIVAFLRTWLADMNVTNYDAVHEMYFDESISPHEPSSRWELPDLTRT